VLRRNGVTGDGLLKNLAKLYQQHNLRDWLDRRNGQPEDGGYPRIICSEGLV
jgi:hypothetical protein